MTYKKFTDEEIIKALEYCSEPCSDCDECPLYYCAYCSSFGLHRYALYLINRQKAFIESQNELISKLALVGKNAKAEAYKEFAERLKEKKLQSTTDKRICTNEMIDNLLKEMVGEEE
nr:MAG TPA: hypothetical protein [Bacteriophage sp.]